MFEQVARLLLPDSDSRVVRCDGRWSLEWSLPTDAPVIWGRDPMSCGAGVVPLAQNAVRRELTLARLRRRPPKPLTVSSVQRWEPTVFHRGRFSGLRSAAAAGALVELGNGAPHDRLVDLAAKAAGARARVTAFRPGTGGSLLAPIETEDGRRLILRVGEAGNPADPHRGAAALERLAPLRLPNVPLPAGHGRVGPVAWSAESELRGKRPCRAGRRLSLQAMDLCLRLPRGMGSPTAFEQDLEAIVARLPALRRRLSRVRAAFTPRISSLPAVMRHGDLWAGNLLVERGVLRGVVDWDAWHPAAVPGTDLLHLLAMQEAVSRGRSLGELWPERPWEWAAFRQLTGGYWRALGLAPNRDVREAVAWAWWATQVAGSLARLPELATDEQWLRRNVEVVLTTFEQGTPCES
jgi:Phosphotransferase enzyme family